MTSVQTLDDTQRAVVQLLLKQGKSYHEIAEVLGIDADAVRARAHAALDALGPPSAGLTASRRAEVADYLLGQQPDSEREATRNHLAESPAARAWARSVAAELRPLAGGDLPDIPEARDTEPDEDEDGGEPLRRDGPGRSSRLGGILLLVGVAVVAAVVVILLVSGGGDDSGTTSTSASTSTPSQQQQQQQQAQTSAQPTPVAQINLHAANGSGAVGVAQVLATGNQRGLAILGQKLAPSTKTSAYAVWLYSSQSKAKLLGFVDPPVGKSGKFQNVIAVPAGADQYRELVVTRERGNPRQPGTIVLRGKLTLG
jgi:Anti-sigma-K factor rskA, C-terminal/Sigma-70, region 4